MYLVFEIMQEGYLYVVFVGDKICLLLFFQVTYQIRYSIKVCYAAYMIFRDFLQLINQLVFRQLLRLMLVHCFLHQACVSI